MAATVIDGKALAAKCKERVKAEAGALSKRPGLAVIIVGDNPASRTCVNSQAEGLLRVRHLQRGILPSRQRRARRS